MVNSPKPTSLWEFQRCLLLWPWPVGHPFSSTPVQHGFTLLHICNIYTIYIKYIYYLFNACIYNHETHMSNILESSKHQVPALGFDGSPCQDLHRKTLRNIFEISSPGSLYILSNCFSLVLEFLSLTCLSFVGKVWRGLLLFISWFGNAEHGFVVSICMFGIWWFEIALVLLARVKECFFLFFFLAYLGVLTCSPY